MRLRTRTAASRRADQYCAQQDEYAISQPKPNPLRRWRQRPQYAGEKAAHWN
jgi:hypothetical protein